MASPVRATLIGFAAVLMWSTMATMVASIQTLPIFLTLTIAYISSGSTMMLVWGLRGELRRDRFTMPPKLWVMGIASVFGFHVSYYIGMHHAPPVDVLLLINFWPLLMVLFSAFNERQRLHWWHIVGALTGFGGIVIITSQKGPFTFSHEYFLGYAAGICCAVIWAAYSVISRRNSALLPPGATSIFCVASLPCALILHLLLERAPTTVSLHQLFAALLMGAFPMVLAYTLWDIGIRKGDIRTLGALSYLGPLCGTTLLIFTGFAVFCYKIVLAAALIIGGAFVGSLGMWLKKR